MGRIDVLGEPIGVEERRIRCDVTTHVICRADEHEQLGIGPQTAGARRPDGDGALGRRRSGGPMGRMRAGHGQVDGGRGGQPLGSAHESIGFVGVVGAFGLTQQGRDTGQHLVVGHGAKLRK